MKKCLWMLLLACCVNVQGMKAQVATLVDGTPYFIHNATGNGSLVLTQTTTNTCVIAAQTNSDANQQWVFESDNGAYKLKNKGTGQYAMMKTSESWNTWDVSFANSLPSDVSKGEYTIESLIGKYVAIKQKSTGKYFGTDALVDGSPVYLDKDTSNAGAKWYLELVSSDYATLFSQTSSTAADSIVKIFEEYNGIAGQLGDSLQLINDKYETIATEDSYKEGVLALRSFITYVCTLGTQLKSVKAQLSHISYILNTTNYPGNEALAAVYEQYNAIVNESSTTNPLTLATLTSLPATLTGAIRSYVFTQKASESAPAEYTLLLQHPWFSDDSHVPASNSDADITAAGQTDKTKDGTGWVRGSTSADGEQIASYRQLRNCWNAWASNFNGDLDVHQDLTELKNGYYSITCDAITQSGCLNDQHAYVSSTTKTVNSPNMTTEGWAGDDATGNGTWEELNTSKTDKILVGDGKLTIGFRGTRNTSATNTSNGWFCVTNFRLYYCGAASSDELVQTLKNKLAECQAGCDTMVFKGDKAAYQKVIDESKNATDEESINTALVNLNKAQAAAATSAEKQYETLQGSYKAIKDSIAAGVYDAPLTAVMKAAIDAATALINKDGQTYACRDTIVNCLRAYRYDYADAYTKAIAQMALCTQQSSKDLISSNINAQLPKLKAGLCPPAEIAEYVNQLERALAEAAANEAMSKGGTDYTALIVNAGCNSTGLKVVPKGWTVKMTSSGNSQPCSCKQQSDGDVTGYYLDAWNGTSKALLYTASQTLTSLPNGTYTLRAQCRTSGDQGKEGTYLFAIPGTDSVKTVLSLVKRELCNVTEYTQGNVKAQNGSDSITYALDSYGSIWAAAAKATDFGQSGSASDLAIYNANGGKGFGWHFVELSVEVVNHRLTVGFTNDSTFTMGHKDTDGNPCTPFTGTWLSVDNFTLTQTAQGDNAGWSPVTAVNAVAASEELIVHVSCRHIITNVTCTIYNVNGQIVDGKATLAPGVYIVTNRAQTRKVAVF